MNSVKLKKNDEVEVIAGKDKEKTGRILKLFPAKQKAIVEGINRVKRHRKPTQKDQHGGIKEEERPIHISNVMLVCSSCHKKVRVGIKHMDDGERVRICKSCKAILDK